MRIYTVNKDEKYNESALHRNKIKSSSMWSPICNIYLIKTRRDHSSSGHISSTLGSSERFELSVAGLDHSAIRAVPLCIKGNMHA